MISFLTLIYVALLAILVKLKVLPNKPGTWMSTLAWMLILLIVLFIPMQWGAPSGPARLMTRSIQIIPNVTGPVTEVPVESNVPLSRGDVLFRIDPTSFEAAVAQANAGKARVEAQLRQDRESLSAAEAQLRQAESALGIAQQQFDRNKGLVEKGTIPANRLEQYQIRLDAAVSAEQQAKSAVEQARAELGAVIADGTPAKLAEIDATLDKARWDFEQTTVRAPSAGYVTYLALRPGQRVTNFPLQPAMIFIDTSEKAVAAQINQIHMRFVEIGQAAELTFKTRPGQIFTGKVSAVLEVASQGQVVLTGTVPTAQQIQAEPFFVRIELDENEAAKELSPGAVGTVAIYTDSVTQTHIIRKVMIRMQAIMNYILPWL